MNRKLERIVMIFRHKNSPLGDLCNDMIRENDFTIKKLKSLRHLTHLIEPIDQLLDIYKNYPCELTEEQKSFRIMVQSKIEIVEQYKDILRYIDTESWFQLWSKINKLEQEIEYYNNIKYDMLCNNTYVSYEQWLREKKLKRILE